MHLPSHGFCIFLYGALILGYLIHALSVFYDAPGARSSFSTEEASSFGSVRLKVEVDCRACLTNANWGTKYEIIYNYTNVAHCSPTGSSVIKDKASSDVVLCRSTDDILDESGIRIRIGNITNFKSRPGPHRATVSVSHGDMKMAIPVAPGHEKTVLFGLTATRDKEGCTSSSDCTLKRHLYLASVQYDGPVDWRRRRLDNRVAFGGGLVHIRMLRYANVHTTGPDQTLADVLAAVGGAGAFLLLVLGILRKCLEYTFKDDDESGERRLSVKALSKRVTSFGKARSDP